MKICLLTSNLNRQNGYGRFSSRILAGARKAGHEVVVLKEIDDDKEGHVILRRKYGVFGSALRARKYIKGCDVVHANDAYSFGLIATLANIGLGKKIVITAVGTNSIAPLYSRRLARFMEFAYKSADKIVAISEFTKKELLKKIPTLDIIVKNHGVEFNRFYAERQPSEEKFILSVGALKPRKGYHISLVAFAEAKKKIPDLRYKIVGSQERGTYFAELKNQVQNLGIEESVDFLSGLSDMELKNLYAAAQAFILVSLNDNHSFEGFGLVFLEAAAAGLPVIGTLGNGIEDAVNDGVNGILVPQGDGIATARAIEEVVGNEKKNRAMGDASYEWAKAHTVEKEMQGYIEIYEGGV